MTYTVIGVYDGDSVKDGINLGSYEGMNQLEVQLFKSSAFKDNCFDGTFYNRIVTGEEVGKEEAGVKEVRESPVTHDRLYIIRDHAINTVYH